MSWTAKITIVLLCFSLCGAGTFVASTHAKKGSRKKQSNSSEKSRPCPARLDSGVIGIVTRSSDIAFLRGATPRSCNRAGTNKILRAQDRHRHTGFSRSDSKQLQIVPERFHVGIQVPFLDLEQFVTNGSSPFGLTHLVDVVEVDALERLIDL